MAKRKAAETPSSIGSFEESLTELQVIVADLEEGALGLESSLARFERGVGLLRACYVILDSAEQKIEVLAQVEAIGSSQSEPAPPVGVAGKNVVARDGDREDGPQVLAEVVTEVIGNVEANGMLAVGEPSLF